MARARGRRPAPAVTGLPLCFSVLDRPRAPFICIPPPPQVHMSAGRPNSPSNSTNLVAGARKEKKGLVGWLRNLAALHLPVFLRNFGPGEQLAAGPALLPPNRRLCRTGHTPRGGAAGPPSHDCIMAASGLFPLSFGCATAEPPAHVTRARDRFHLFPRLRRPLSLAQFLPPLSPESTACASKRPRGRPAAASISAIGPVMYSQEGWFNAVCVHGPRCWPAPTSAVNLGARWRARC